MYKPSRVGRLEIIDWSSSTAVEILKSEISVEELDQIIGSTNITPIVVSGYATQLVDALKNSTLSLPFLRETLYATGFKRSFDFTLHADASFIKVTTRHL